MSATLAVNRQMDLAQMGHEPNGFMGPGYGSMVRLTLNLSII